MIEATRYFADMAKNAMTLGQAVTRDDGRAEVRLYQDTPIVGMQGGSPKHQFWLKSVQLWKTGCSASNGFAPFGKVAILCKNGVSSTKMARDLGIAKN